jgi:hypothetical protein
VRTARTLSLARAAALMTVVAAMAVATVAEGGDEAPRPDDPASLFAAGTEALASERPSEAIAQFEALGDRGVVDAALSFDRGLAYAERVRSGGEQPGDLGRAAHGFEEAKQLSRDPALVADANRALATIREEVARRRARSGETAPLETGDGLARSIVKLLPENVWAILAAVLSAILSIAIVMRARASAPRAKVAATTTLSVSGGLLFAFALLAVAARDARLHLREGVVVVPNARLLDEKHVVRGDVAPLPEGVKVRIVDEAPPFARIATGGVEGHLPASAVLPLAKR